MDGLFRTQTEVDEYNAKYDVQYGIPGVGRLRYADVNGDGAITTSDQAYIGSNNPKLLYGLNFSAAWRGWDISMFFSGMVRDAYNSSKLYTDFFPLGEGLGNHSTRLLDAVRGYEDFLETGIYTSDYAAVSTIDTNQEGVQNSWYMEDGSYLKMKNLVIGYTLPKEILSKTKIRTARVYLQAQNIFTLTKYTGPDPESLGYPYPYSFNMVLGLNIGF